MRFTVLIAALGIAVAARAEEPGFLFDALRLPHYRYSWERLVKTVQPTPDWLLSFERDYDGAAGEMTPIAIEGKPYKLSYVCDPEKCLNHKFEVLFDAEGIRAYGALGGNNVPPAFFGDPNAAQQDALAKALNPAPVAAPKAEATKPAQPKSE
jgi:Inhibitor of vertebrate lysozyme (Ivy)